MNTSRMTAWAAVLMAGLLVRTAGADIVMETVTVGNPGEAADTHHATPGYGAADHTYSSGNCEVTAGQYTAFLNALAATETYGLCGTAITEADALGACCVRPVGEGYCVCIGDHTAEICELVGGVWDAFGSCDDPAYTCPCGACCRGADCEFGYARDCDGVYVGAGSACEPQDPCVTGCCCDDYTGHCEDDVLIGFCPPEQRFGAGLSCAELEPPCGILGACCVVGACLADTVESTCDLIGGQWYGGQHCDCTLADCRGDHLPADSNSDGAINVFDIDPFVMALTDRCAWLVL